MTIRGARDFYAEGFRIMEAHKIEVTDDYLLSYVEVEIMKTCQYHNNLGNGYIDIDGQYWLENMRFWVRKKSE